MAGVGTFIVCVVVLAIMMPFMNTFMGEYAPSSVNATTMSNLTVSFTTNYTAKVLNPLIGATTCGNATSEYPCSMTANSVNSSYIGSGLAPTATQTGMASIANRIGFMVAFIITGLYNIYISLIYLPVYIGNCVGVLTSVLLPGAGGYALGQEITAFGELFIGILFVATYCKYPIW